MKLARCPVVPVDTSDWVVRRTRPGVGEVKVAVRIEGEIVGPVEALTLTIEDEVALRPVGFDTHDRSSSLVGHVQITFRAERKGSRNATCVDS